MDQSKPQPKAPTPETNPTAPPDTNLDGIQAVPMPQTTSAPDLTPTVHRLEYLARPKVHQIEDTLKRFDALLDSKSKTNLQKLASEQRKVQSSRHAGCQPEITKARPATSALDGSERDRKEYYRSLSNPKGYCLNDTLDRFGGVLEEGRRDRMEEQVGKLLAAREAGSSRHLRNCPSGVALKESASFGVPPPGYNAVEVAKTSNISVPPLRILEEMLERNELKPEMRQHLEIMVQKFKAEREITSKHHIQNHLQNDDPPDVPAKPSLPPDYDPIAIAETSKLSWPNQHVLQDTLSHFGKSLKPTVTDTMKTRIQDQSQRHQATHKQHLHDCHLQTPPRPRSARPPPGYDPIAVAKSSKVSIPVKHVVKDTLDRYGKIIKPEARKNMQQMINDRDLQRKTTHKQHSSNCKYMRAVQREAAAARKRGRPPPGYNAAEVAKTSKVSRPNSHVLKDALQHYGESFKPAVRESMQNMIREREVERKTTHKQHLLDCHLQTPPRAPSVRPSPDYDPIAVAKTSKVSIPPRHILQDTLAHYGDSLKPAARESMQRMIEDRNTVWESTHQRHDRNCHYMRDVRQAKPPSFPPPPGYDPAEVAKESKIAQPYRRRLQDTLDLHGQSLPERAREYLLKLLEEQRHLREVQTRCHRINCHLPEPPEPRQLRHAFDEKNIVKVIEKFKAKLKREAFDHLAGTVFDHVPDLVLATDIAKLAGLDKGTQQLVNVLYSTVASYNGKPVTAHDHELYVHLSTGLASFIREVVDSVQREKDASDKKDKKQKKDKKEKGKEKEKTAEKAEKQQNVLKQQKDKDDKADKKDVKKQPTEPSRSSMTTEIFGHLARDMAYAQGANRNVLKRIIYN